MTLVQRTIPRVVKVAGVAGFAGLGIYCTKQFSTVLAESNEPKTVFSGLGFTTLRLQSIKTVNHNTKRLVFEYPDKTARSGLPLTCIASPKSRLSVLVWIADMKQAALLAITHPEGRWLPVLRPYTPISDLSKSILYPT